MVLSCRWIVPLPIETLRGPGRASRVQSACSGGTKITERCRSRTRNAACARSEAPRADRKDRNEEREEEKGAARVDPDCSSPARESGNRHWTYTHRGLHLSVQQERQGLASIHHRGGGLITNNGTRAWFFGGQLFLKEDRYEVTAGYGRGNLEYNLYGIGLVAGNAGLKLPLSQTGHVFFGEVVRRIAWKIFVGPRFIDGGSFLTINPNNGEIPPLPPDVGINTTLTSLGFRVVRDTRPNHFYPTGGDKLEFTADFFSQALGSKYSFAHYKFNFDKYWNLSKSQVLAYDLYVCDTGGQPPFYGNCIYGASNELRGYVAGNISIVTCMRPRWNIAYRCRGGWVSLHSLGSAKWCQARRNTSEAITCSPTSAEAPGLY